MDLWVFLGLIDELFHLSFVKMMHQFASFRGNIRLRVGMENALNVELRPRVSCALLQGH